LEELKQAADVVLCLPSQRVLNVIDENTSLVETFRFTADLLAEGVRTVRQLAGRPGLIHVDLADLCELFRNRHTACYFAFAEASGTQRGRDAVEKLLLSPLLENGALLREATTVLASVAAGPDLSIAEVTRISEQLKRECEHAEILLGARVDAALGKTLRLTLIGGEKPAELEQAERAPTSELSADQAGAEIGDSLETDFFRRKPAARRPRSRFVPPPPDLSGEEKREIVERYAQRRGRRGGRLEQAMLPLEVISKGRFEKSEPTIHKGEDLDVPTFVRRGLVLN
jgi:cell division protein FtsZ